MSVTILIVGSASGAPTPYDGLFVAGEYRPGSEDFGELDVTDDESKARRFPSIVEARDFWAQEHPQGLGGQNLAGKNRPLTYFTVTFARTKEEAPS